MHGLLLMQATIHSRKDRSYPDQTYKEKKMRKILIITIAIAASILLTALPSSALDRETIDNLTLLLSQPGQIYWADIDIDDATLIEGFNEIHTTAVQNDDVAIRASVIYAMGETGFDVFVPAIIGELEYDPSTACYALGKIPSAEGVEALIPMLDQEDMFIREAAIWALGSIPYTSSMDESKEEAKSALTSHLESEDEAWLVDMTNAAIVFIESGVAIDPAFDTNIEGLML